jgi:4-hydroxyacetophenone monooxygenase
MEPYRVDPAHHDPTGHSVNAGLAVRAGSLLDNIHPIVDDPELLEKVVPDYPAVGKRILQDDGTWLRTLLRPDVELVRTAVDHIERDGVVTVDGRHHPADVIGFATGFRHNDFLATLEVTGRGGRRLREVWGDEPVAHLGITVKGFPNLFCVYGPGTNLAAGAGLFYHSEFQVHYAMDAIHRVLAAGGSSVEVPAAAHDDYARRYPEEIGQMVWAHPSIEHSHYKHPQGKVFALSPWALDQYWAWTRELEPADHHIR